MWVGLLPSTQAFAQTTPETDPSTASPLVQILTPVTNVLTGLPNLLTQARDLKLLVISADGTEPSLAAIRAVLDQLGTPYDVTVLTQSGGKLPKLNDFSKGFYQGIVLTTGNLATCQGGPCRLALPAEGWLALDKYAVTYGVRMLSYYTFPDPRYGISWTGGTAFAGPAQFLPAAAPVFPDLKRSAPLPLEYTYMYFANLAPAAGETTTPILTLNGQTIGVLHKKADKREYLALTFDHNPNLLHSVALGFGLVNWVTKGMFIGKREAFYSPQIDDILIGSDLFDSTKTECRPSGFILDPTSDPSGACPFLRISGSDLDGTATWQDRTNSSLGYGIKVNMAFNGFGTTSAGGASSNDSLVASTRRQRSKFFWINHTYDHENLDCFLPAPNSGICMAATYAQSRSEIDQNTTIARNLDLVFESNAMVTPNLSGLNNPSFLAAAFDRGIRHFVSDSSLGASLPFNTGRRSPINNSIILTPRRPTNVFYNTSNPSLGMPGSLVDEYNYFYGPNGISRIGGPGGPPFFTTEQSYQQILTTESDAVIKNMLRGEVYPVMFHQTNLWQYNTTNSLFSDLSDAILQRFNALSNVPVKSLSQAATGEYALDRMSFNQSGVSATLAPGLTLTIRVNRSARIPITGLCRLGCDQNGGQPVTHYNVNPLLPTIVLLPN